MGRRKDKLLKVIIWLSAILSLTGCGKTIPDSAATDDQPKEMIVITLDIQSTDFEYAREVSRYAALFHQVHPEYSVELVTSENMTYEDYQTARSVKILTGRSADILYLSGDPRMEKYIEKGALADLSEYLSRDSKPRIT